MDDAMKSVELAAKLRSDDLNGFIFTPYHGTELRKIAVDAGFISDDLIVEMRADDDGSYLNMPPPYMSKNDIQYLFNNFCSMVRDLE